MSIIVKTLRTPEATPIGIEATETDYEAIKELVRRISTDSSQYTHAGEAVRLAGEQIIISAYAVARGIITRAAALSIAETHNIASNGGVMPEYQRAQYLDVLTAAMTLSKTTPAYE